MKARRRNLSPAFTMMELTVAIAMFAIAVAGTASFIYHADRATHAAHSRHIAILAAQSEIERLRSLPFSDLQPCTEQPLPISHDLQDQLPTLSLVLTIIDVPDTDGWLKEVRVKATWLAVGAAKSFELPTMMTSLRSPVVDSGG